MNPSLRRALGSLKKNDSIVILKADKGNATVVLDKGSYGKKCEAFLQPPTYKKLTKDPTHKYNRKITELLKDLKTAKYINKVLFDRLKPSNTKAPRFYGLPKIHKPDMPLRPIVSAIGSPMYSLAKFVTKIISPLIGRTIAHVKNSLDFRNMILKERIDESEIMVSFDVKSLFTNVPIDKTLEVISNSELINDQSLKERFLSLRIST